MPEELTKPHDYRGLLEACPGLTIVGGQAINVWVITYLDPELSRSDKFGSHDLDVLAKGKVAEIIAALPNWRYEKTPLWAFNDSRLLTLQSCADDGRPLAVEVLAGVRGLEKADLDAVVQIEQEGVKYRVLDPIAMLRAKAANVREINQDGPPPRQDRAHLQLIAQCVLPFLRDAHNQAVGDHTLHNEYFRTVSRTFRTLTDRKTLKTLLQEGIQPLTLVPEELKGSPIAKVRTAYEYQIPILKALIGG